MKIIVARELLVMAASIALAVTPLAALAASAESGAATVRLSFPFGQGDKDFQPWLGLGFSEHSQAVPWAKEDDSEESSVNFNLAEPEMAFVIQNKRTLLSLARQDGTPLKVGGCGDPAPEQDHNASTNTMLAVGGAAVVGMVTYFVLNENGVLATGC